LGAGTIITANIGKSFPISVILLINNRFIKAICYFWMFYEHKFMKYPPVIALYLLLTTDLLTAQQSGKNRSIYEKYEEDLNSLMVSFDYSTNTNLLSSISNDIRQPSLATSVAFISRWGIDLMITGNAIANSDDSLKNYSSEVDFIIGYNFRPHKNWTIYPSYTKFLYSRNANSFRSLFNSDIHTDIDYDYRFLNLGVSAGYLMGEQRTFYMSFRNSYKINIENFLFRESTLLIQPGIDLNFGNYEYLNLFYLDQLRQSPLFYASILFNSRVLRKYAEAELKSHPDMTSKEILDALFEKRAEDSFKLTSVSIGVPVFFISGRFGFNAGLFLNIPTNQPDYLSNESLFYFSAGISYCLDF
jgi:hypothetical protein